MSKSIGESLGILLAHFEDELRIDSDDVVMLDRIHKISDIYRNFSEGEFLGFRAEFEQGYMQGKSDLEQDYIPPSSANPSIGEPT